MTFCMSCVLHGQGGQTEYQARILSHVQVIEEGKSTGFAGWFILPNVMKTSPLRALMLSGILLNRQEGWVELMLGAVVNTSGIVEPVVNTRVLEKGLHWLELFSELEYNFSSNRFYANGILAAPIASPAFRIGVEVDLFLSPNGRLSNIGPRFTIQLPFLEGACKSLLLTTAYKFQSDNTRILRQYLVVNF